MPTSTNPACAIEEYASMRFTSVWVSASTEPTSMVTIAIAQSTGSQSHRLAPSPT